MNTLLSGFGILLMLIASNANVVKRGEGNPHALFTPGMGMKDQCLQCWQNEKLSLAECLMKPDDDPDKYEDCQMENPECMTELWLNRNKLVFISSCQQLESCLELEQNEPKLNHCDSPPIVVKTRCRYCCDGTNLTQGYFCPPPSSPVECNIHGDPHFRTFDTYKYHEGGLCDEYMLMNFIVGGIHTQVSFTEIKHHHYHVKTLSIMQYEQVLWIGENNHTGHVIMMLDGVEVTDDFHWHIGVGDQFHGSMLEVITGGYDYTITMDLDADGIFDLNIIWGFHRVIAKLAQPYSACFELRGLCGNSDGDPDNEFIYGLPDGTNATTIAEFHHAWGFGQTLDASCAPAPLFITPLIIY